MFSSVSYFITSTQRVVLAVLTRTRTKGHVVDGSCVAVDLLQCCVAAGVPDGDGAVFTARHQQSPRWIQTDGVHLHRVSERWYYRRKTGLLLKFLVFGSRLVCYLLKMGTTSLYIYRTFKHVLSPAHYHEKRNIFNHDKKKCIRFF